jgi:hypothetical protein
LARNVMVDTQLREILQQSWVSSGLRSTKSQATRFAFSPAQKRGFLGFFRRAAGLTWMAAG